MNRLAPELPEAPEVQLCRCGVELQLDEMSLPGGLRMIPVCNPCPECKELDDVDRVRRQARGRLLASGIPERLHGYSMNVTDTQDPSQDDAGWMNDVRNSGRLGISLEQSGVMGDAMAWKPSDGSVWIEGSVGRGKSVLAAAMLTKVLGVDRGNVHRLHTEEELERLGRAHIEHLEGPYNRGCVRVAGNSVTGRMCTEGELLAASKKTHGYKGDDGAWDKLCDVDVLVLDDFGTEGDHPVVVKVLERLIDIRYRKHKPIIISTNMTWAKVVVQHPPSHGKRVASRLRQLVENRVWILRGEDWRKT